MNTLTRILSLLSASLVLTSWLSAANQPLSVLLQKGIYAEETEGDLEAAISIYQGIVDEAQANQALVAQALYRLGRCHAKQGDPAEALSVFRKLIERYPSESEVVAEARRQMAELGGSVPGTPAELLTHPDANRWQDLSPDGRFATFFEYYPDLRLTVQNLTTQGSWSVDNREGTHPDERPWGSPAFSPDGSRVAYSWVGKREGGGVRILEAGETNPVVVARTEGYFSVRDWSPDQTRLLGVETKGDMENFRMVLVLTQTGAVQPVPLGLESAEIDRIGMAKFTPDGQRFVYQGNKGICLFNLQSREHQTLIDHPAGQKLVGRIPGTSTFLFSGERKGKTSLFAFEIAGDQLGGEPRAILDFDGKDFLTVTRDGTVYYRVRTTSRTIHAASVDFATGKLLQEPHSVGGPVAGDKSSPMWSPDGRRLAWEAPGDMLVVQDQSTRQHRGVSWSGKLRGPGLSPYRSWSRESDTFLAVSYPFEGMPGIFAIDVDTGNVTPVVTRQYEPDVKNWVAQPYYSIDNKAVLFWRRVFAAGAPYGVGQTRWTEHILRRDLATGEEREIYQPKGMLNTWCSFAPSRDESRLALVMMETLERLYLEVVDLASGSSKRLQSFKQPGGGGIWCLSWTADDQGIVFLREADPEKPKPEFWRVRVTDGEAIQIDLGLTGLSHVALHPDGKTLALGVGHEKTETFRQNVRTPLTSRNLPASSVIARQRAGHPKSSIGPSPGTRQPAWIEDSSDEDSDRRLESASLLSLAIVSARR